MSACDRSGARARTKRMRACVRACLSACTCAWPRLRVPIRPTIRPQNRLICIGTKFVTFSRDNRTVSLANLSLSLGVSLADRISTFLSPLAYLNSYESGYYSNWIDSGRCRLTRETCRGIFFKSITTTRLAIRGRLSRRRISDCVKDSPILAIKTFRRGFVHTHTHTLSLSLSLSSLAIRNRIVIEFAYIDVAFSSAALYLHDASINELLIWFEDFYGRTYGIAVSEGRRREREEGMHRRRTRLKDAIRGVIVFRARSR